MAEREISQAVIRRLPRYYRYLGELLENGVERISSNDLSKKKELTARKNTTEREQLRRLRDPG